jgi:D-psicose/D-tagatose/L-ribulose 3-epimerase
MKYGIFYAYWTQTWDADYRYYIDKASSLGFDILEIACGALVNSYHSDEEILDLGEYAKEKGMILTCGYGPALEHNIASGDPAVVHNALDFYREAMRRMHLLDIKLLCGGLYGYWPVDYSIPFDKKLDFKNSVANMKELAKIGEAYDIMLCMEVLNRFEGYLINDCAEALHYVQEVDHPNVKIHLDTFHMSIEEDSIPDAIRMAGDQLGHLHFGERNRKVPGKGTIPWLEIGKVLKEMNYQGAAVFEPFTQQGGEVGHAIKLFRELVPDNTVEKLDWELAESLHFIKHVLAM